MEVKDLHAVRKSNECEIFGRRRFNPISNGEIPGDATVEEGKNLNAIFAASLMCMDFLHVADSLDILNRHCQMLHADVMDGHYCPNLTLSPAFIRAVRSHTALPIDTHLMVTNPGDYIDVMAEAGADYISLHVETVNVNAFRLINRIRSAGRKAGLVLNPATPLSMAETMLPLVSILTIMTVDVGYAGQPFISHALDKIRQADALIRENGYDCIIQTDGACNKETYGPVYGAGGRAFVMGSTGLFGLEVDLETACRRMKREFIGAVAAESAP